MLSTQHQFLKEAEAVSRWLHSISIPVARGAYESQL